MVNWVSTALIGLVVLAVLCIAAYIIIRDRRMGKNSCGCNCSGCGGECLPPVVPISIDEEKEDEEEEENAE